MRTKPAAWATVLFALMLAGTAVHALSDDVLVKETAAGSRVSGAALGRRVNEGSGFQLLCRGGPTLRIGLSAPWVMQVAGDFPGDIRLKHVSTMTMDFNRTEQPPDFSGRNLQPGECSPAGFTLPDAAPTQVRVRVNVGTAWDTSAAAAERLPSTANVPGYLQDANHYWSFLAIDFGEGYFTSTDSRHWKPEFYKGPTPSTIYQPSPATAVRADRSATTTDATSRIGALRGRREGHAGAPVVPSPATPVSPPPIVAAPIPAGPVTFSPPLLQNGEQLWACADTAADERNAGACFGEESAQAYCQLRDAQSAPDLRIEDARPGIPVHSVNGDICLRETCRVVSELQCDH